MSAEPARHLRRVKDTSPLIVVDEATGQRMGTLAEHMQGVEDHIAGLQRDVKAEHLRYANLKRDKAREAKESPYWPFAYRLFKYWIKVCKKSSRYQFKTDRFEAALEHLRDDPLLCVKAVDGAAFDPWYPPPGKNGKSRPQNGWNHIFKNSEKVEDFAARVPANWQPPAGFVEALEGEPWYEPKEETK